MVWRLLARWCTRFLRFDGAVDRADEMDTTCTSHEARSIALWPPSHQTDFAMSSLSSGWQTQPDSLLWRLSRLAIAVVCALAHRWLRTGLHNSDGEYESATRRGSSGRPHTMSDIPRPQDRAGWNRRAKIRRKGAWAGEELDFSPTIPGTCLYVVHASWPCELVMLCDAVSELQYATDCSL